MEFFEHAKFPSSGTTPCKPLIFNGMHWNTCHTFFFLSDCFIVISLRPEKAGVDSSILSLGTISLTA